MTHSELWQAVLGDIELSISKANFVTWFKNTTILSIEKDRVVVGVPNGFAKEWLENKYHNSILKTIQNHMPEITGISCTIYNPQSSSSSAPRSVDAAVPHDYVTPRSMLVDSPPAQPSLSVTNDASLNPRYTFDTFVVGESNELAKAACHAVCEHIGTLYNPLFLYGGVGLGKTHLLQAIGNALCAKMPTKKVRYVTAERFASGLIDSIKQQTVENFKKSYQGIDLLIIDDVQFLSGKEKTQQEFFHVFNALYQLNKQVVMSSDRAPKAIATLEERLRSRFEGGMIVDIGKPDLETRLAILHEKAAEKEVFLEDAVLRFIAENIKSNVRELEGALNRVLAMADLRKTTLSVSDVKSVLAELIDSGKRKGVQGKHIIRTVSAFYEIDWQELVTRGRKKEVVRPRQIAMYLLRSELNVSYPGIGDFFGGRDHTTALHAYDKISKELLEDRRLQEEVSILKEKIYQV